jgi:S1-C subfamily serine protease
VNLVDVVLAAVVVAAAVHGLRLGALLQVLTFGGFLVGMTVGALIADLALTSFHVGALRDALALVLVLGPGVVLGAAGRVLGGWSHVAIRRRHLGSVDGVLGVAVAVVAVLMSVWLVASVLSQSRYTWLNAKLQQSDILKAVESVMPPVPTVFSRVQAILADNGFPPVFQQFAPPLAPSVPLMPTAQAQALGTAEAASAVKLLGTACGYLQEGSGFVVGKGLVVTNAHVIAGERSPRVEVGGVTYRATPILFDPNFDLAVLRTSAPLGPPLTLDPLPVSRESTAVVLGFPEDGPLTIGPAGVAASITAVGRNIYNQGSVVRHVYQIDADVEPGNSGGPMVAPDGRVVGVVFSRSTSQGDVGYALASPGVLQRVDAAEFLSGAVGTGACVAD